MYTLERLKNDEDRINFQTFQQQLQAKQQQLQVMQQAANLQQATILQAAALSAATQNAWNQSANPSQMNPLNDPTKSITDAQQNWMQQWYFTTFLLFASFSLTLLLFIGLVLVTMHHRLLLINNGMRTSVFLKQKTRL